MAWYPDWVVALNAVAKGEDAKLSKHNAEDVIRELMRLQSKVRELQEQLSPPRTGR
jgi:hypothetical protein